MPSEVAINCVYCGAWGKIAGVLVFTCDLQSIFVDILFPTLLVGRYYVLLHTFDPTLSPWPRKLNLPQHPNLPDQGTGADGLNCRMKSSAISPANLSGSLTKPLLVPQAGLKSPLMVNLSGLRRMEMAIVILLARWTLSSRPSRLRSINQPA